MKSDVQVAVIGGGIVGASVLYWLTKLGWTDALLLERRELTSGSTWHSAGNTTYLGPYPAMTKLFAGSIRTYLQAEGESGQSVSFHQTGSLRLAATERELNLFHTYKLNYDKLGIPFHVRTPEEVADLHPLLNVSGIFGAAHTPTDGHVDPTGATQALALAARNMGATVERHCTVTALTREAGHWAIETANGTVRASNVVVATSFWAREMLSPLGLNLPVFATQHQEVITQSIPGLEALDHEVPAWRDSYMSGSVRQEAKGVLAGVYEAEPKFWALDGIPEDFKEDLFPPELDRIMPHLERLIERMPSFGEAGIKVINNGPMCWTPDGLPMLGPMPDQDGLWLATGFNVGIGTGGGSAEFLAHWMTTGSPPFDLSVVHADRFGNEMSREAALAAIRGVYAVGYELPDSF
ncbi:NAD(P)/FAD-dependent oxidoreductase [Ruegeria atlantica]|uniref:NAD(P)/FAD-dependent oxidoreductase n=1 Tax=Ruegeria atlantica TaxID=81569 RepID=UPI00147BF70C|nr:FAD-binding oxidoreductase [Ruegeria atlantica]